jgi:hypothetical protein
VAIEWLLVLRKFLYCCDEEVLICLSSGQESSLAALTDASIPRKRSNGAERNDESQ